MFARLKARGAVAAVLVSALVAGGAFVGGGAAYAAEPEPTAVSEAPAASTEESAPAVEAETAPAAGETSSPEVTEGDAQNESADQGSDAAPVEETPAAVEEAPAAEVVEDAPAEGKAVTADKPAAKTAARAAKAALPESLEPVRANGGQLTWNFKDSWVGYLLGSGGQVNAYGGATAGAMGRVSFPEAASTTYNPKTGTGVINYTGGVEWNHPEHGFAIAMQNPQVTVAADGSAVLKAEMSTSNTSSASDVALADIATLPALGAATEANELRTWTDVATTFAAQLPIDNFSGYAGQAASTIKLSTSTAAVPEKVWTPEIQVFLNGGSKPLAGGEKVYKDDVLTIKGTGFDPESNKVTAADSYMPQGVSTGHYVVFSKFGTEWKPSAGAENTTRPRGPQKWAMTKSSLDMLAPGMQAAVKRDWAEINVDGTWETQLKLADTGAGAAVADGSYGVYTYGAGGMDSASQELELLLDFDKDNTRPVWTPEIQVFLNGGSKPLAGGEKVYKDDVLTIKGTGFDPESNKVTAADSYMPQGVSTGHYVVFSKFGTEWKPSAGAENTTRPRGPQKWAMTKSSLDMLAPGMQAAVKRDWAEINVDGTWETQLKLADTGAGAAVADGSYGVYTYGAGGMDNASQELELLLDFDKDNTRPVWTPEIQVFLKGSDEPLAKNAKVYKDDVLTIKGTGFDPESNKVTAADSYMPQGVSTGHYVVFSKFGTEWKPSAGAENTTRPRGPQKWAMTKSSLDMLAPGMQAAVKRDWAEINVDGTWETQLKLADTGAGAAVADGSYGVYTYGAGGMDSASQELELLLDYDNDNTRPKEWTPEIQVFLKGSDEPLAKNAKVYKDDVLVIKGTGFDPESNKVTEGSGSHLPVGVSTGHYVVFSKFANDWKPSTGAESTSRPGGPQKWAMTQASLDKLSAGMQAGVKKAWSEIHEDGTWETELTLADTGAGAAVLDGNYGVYTYGAGKMDNASQELSLFLDYDNDNTRPAPVMGKPKFEVYKADGTTLLKDEEVYEGDKLVIKGSGFDPYANRVGLPAGPIPNGSPQGTFLVFGEFADKWQPSQGANSSTRLMNKESRKWLLAQDTFNNEVPDKHKEEIGSQLVILDPVTGSFTAEITLKAPATSLDGGNYGIYTYAGGVGSVNAEQELGTLINFKAEKPVEPEPEPEPEPEAGALQWGIKSSFVNYIKYGAGDGSVTGSATNDKNNMFNFVQQKGGSWNADDLTGEIRYSGTVKLAAHRDDETGVYALSMAFKNPVITVKDASTAVMSFITTDANGKVEEIPVVDIALPAKEIAEDGSITWKDAKTSLRAEAVALFGQYKAGQEMDPVTFTVGSSSEVVDPEEPGDGDGENPGTGGEEKPEPEKPGTGETGKKASGSLQWGVKESFYDYIKGGGTIATDGKLVKEKNKIFSFPQQTGGKWNEKKSTGEARYAGYVQFTAHGGVLNLLFQNPTITVTSDTKAMLSVETWNKKGKITRANVADITLPKPVKGKNGEITWTDAKTVVNADGAAVFAGYYKAGQVLDPVTFTVGKAKDVKPTNPTKPTKPETKPVEKPKPVVVPQGNSKQPGSLTWGVSSGFAGYTTGKIAKGAVTSEGVGRSGGAYVFPQASSNWNTASQTGTVQFSGVVTFTGHNGAMVESFSNPVITVNSASSATMNAGGRTFTLDLGSASKVVGSNGEVTWSGVPVGGVISGGGSAGGGSGAGSFSADPLSFTVGAANGTSYGSTEQTAPSTKRTAADAPPATTGITLITDKKKLVAGAEVEFEASGFEPNERDILVVVYSDPIVLDDAAGADENGVVRWIGNLPKDLKPGEHTLTLQGSKNAGVKITVLSKEEAKKAKATADNEIVTAQSAAVERAAAGDLAATGSMLWLWWTAAILLLILAVVGAALVVRQRRTIE
ncbi:HtaA domain-containing protein [Leucobacter sp. cx-42]|uniref:HtaA domain-containing protein n=1 Tax=unclassified Leucobacter TaxID=2621730 RepID=UPI00165E61F5|nr:MULTISPECIES: HtaA domain-containing protein [unclassified Leucobacter]MBC9953905.1 HtaA domain-containing protein [Leucobacter sp. cx-42]